MAKRKPKPVVLSREITPQAALVLDHLASHGPLTQIKAMHYGFMSLTARIAELRRAGVPIVRELKRDQLGKRYASYSLSRA